MRSRLASLSVLALLSLSVGVCAAEELADPPWKFRLAKPVLDNWNAKDFPPADNWQEGEGGFGTADTPNARIGTRWERSDIWARRVVTLDEKPEKPALYLYHDEDLQVWINGTKAFEEGGYITEYKMVPLEGEAAKAVQKGDNTIALHCHQTGGGQFVDVFLVDAADYADGETPDLPQPPRATEPFKSDLITKWGEDLDRENPWSEYPRPQMTREKWESLNGQWDYAVTSADQTDVPSEWEGDILVPFALESKLSGVQKLLHEDQALWYHRTFEAPKHDGRLLLHFEAVDYRCEVHVNGTKVGEHIGGNIPFSVDVTDAVKDAKNELVVRVEDDQEGYQLHGKQTFDPRGIWYTQVSGIWGTVWMEPVPKSYIEDLTIQTSAENGTVTVTTETAGDEADGQSVRLTIDGVSITGKSGQANTLKLENAELWSPDSPKLYDLRVELLGAGERVVDSVGSYAGIRDVGKTRDEDGHLRFTLNGEVVFHWGPLDQGWWPDGLLTPPSDEAMKWEINWLKDAGFNMIRKHIKVEPRRYYYHCDKIGMLVWQDQVSGGTNPPWTRMEPNPKDADWPTDAHEQYMTELDQMIDLLENHPSIVVWVPFNEAWGQHQTVEVGKWTVKRDPTRLVNVASGGNFWPVGDIADHHSYPHPEFPFDESRYKDFIVVVGEFGGHGFPVRDHLWDADRRNWGYGGLPESEAELKERYAESLRRLKDLKDKGVAGAVYTQTTDVEGEVNGLMTYDRKVIKLSADELKKLAAPLTE